MKHIPLHKKVHIWYNNWFAIQIVRGGDEWGFGIRPVFRRKFIDFYLGPITLAFGRHPVLTDARVKHSDSCRGFIFDDEVMARIL
jgi:hypothetical protein